MTLILNIIEGILAICLIVSILLHSGKDTGLSGAFGVGAAGSSGGGSMMERNLNRITVGLLIAFLGIALVLLRI